MKKIISLILTGIMMASMTACSNQEEAVNGEKPTLNVLQIYTSQDVNNTEVAKLLEEKTGYHVNYELLPQDKPYDKLNLIMAGGDSYDVIVMGNNKNVFANYAANDALIDLEPLIEKYGPNVKAKITKESMAGMQIDGVQYGIPNTSAAGVSSSIVIRKDWLDKLGLEMPETVDDFVNVLREFKEKDPGGNGVYNVPLTLAVAHVYCPNLQGAFGLAEDWQDVDGKLVPNIARPEFKEYLEFMRGLYSEGLIDKEFATLKSANAKERFTSGKAGAMVLSYYDMKTVNNTLKKIYPDAELAYIPLLTNEDGKGGISYNKNSVDKIIFIPKTAKHPEDAMKWINAKLEDDLFREYTIGEENVHYEVVDGAYYPILPIFYDERNAASVYLTGVDEEVYPKYWQARIRKDQDIFDAWYFINNDEKYVENLVTSPLSSAPYIKEYDDNIQVDATAVQEMMIGIIAGTEDIASTVDGYVKQWRAEKGDGIEKAVNQWYSSVK